jgi:CheY-like chemotaxis protein
MKGLILDDDAAVVEYIASALEESGVDHTCFLDPVAALREMEVGEYDFAFIDINLPNMDGLEFSRRFKDKYPEADIIFITGQEDYEKAVQAIKVGAYDYIQKAFRRLDIILCVARLIEKRNLYRDQKRMELLRFANDVALELMHELRNPLVAIGGFSKIISNKDLPEERLRRFADIIYEEAVRLEEVLKEILDHLKAGAKQHAYGNDRMRSRISDMLSKRKLSDGTATVNERRGATVAAGTKDTKRRKEMAKPKQRKAAKLVKSAANRTIKKAAAKATSSAGNGIRKKYLRDRNICEVTFKLPKLAAPDAEKVCIVGDFNNWDARSNVMRRLKSGDYTIKLNLEPGKVYQFRYLIDESRWENDWNADNYVKSPFGDSDNSVVKV